MNVKLEFKFRNQISLKAFVKKIDFKIFCIILKIIHDFKKWDSTIIGVTLRYLLYI